MGKKNKNRDTKKTETLFSLLLPRVLDSPRSTSPPPLSTAQTLDTANGRKEREKNKKNKKKKHSHHLTRLSDPNRTEAQFCRVLIAAWRSISNGGGGDDNGGGTTTCICSSCWECFCSTILSHTAPIARACPSILSGHQ
ncbi:hypothetical protein LOK49_LG15G00876 [Camellia lanceoleosa]|uniref:Uncharacterized protein n=1 Tax=Camellia lanceoleosa TaxID=1840588 RepID=A0ACC0F3J6_9ERIC|nr:hypothetical protein LOK49_LG15G00876 [Camellia lanceoleosa]